jgi:hypothetical protein
MNLSDPQAYGVRITGCGIALRACSGSINFSVRRDG